MKGHKGILKRSLAICIAMATVITTVYQPDRTAWAETSTIQPDTVTENEIQTEGTNSFGNLLNKELEEKLDEQKENAGYNVFSLEVTGTTVNVELEALEACTLVVGIYDEAGTTMLGSGTVDVPEKAESATVTVNIDSMPTYFDAKAYLIDSETQAPLCQVFDCPVYTQEMQEFLKKSVNDFDSDRVLNLDDSVDNNFAVFQDNVKYIEEQENANRVTTEDEANNTYVIENASAEIQALQPGDTTALEYAAGQVLIIKVASITLDGTTATIVGEDTSLEEVFEYMKIDTESYTGDAAVDTSNLEEGITYRGMSTSEEVQAQTVAAEDEMTADQAGSADKEGITLKYDIDCSLSSEHNEVKVSGSVEINVKVNLNLCITPTKQYFEFCIDYKLQTSIGVTGKIKFVFPLGKMEFSPVAGVYIRITPKVEEEFSGSLTLTATLTGRVGASITVGASAVNLSKSPTLNTSLRIEGRAYIGVVFEPEIVLVCDQLLRAGVAFRVGAALTLKSDLLEASSGVIHGCKECLSGDISVIISATFELCFLNMDSLTVKKTFETRIKLADCHFSLDYDEFQLCPCPRKGYLAKLKVIDKKGKAVPNATITGRFLTTENGVVKQITSVITDANGKANVYMPYGTQTIQVQSNERQMSQTINKLDKREEITITLKNKVPINSTVFPDDNFRKYISQNFDTNGDGVLSEGEIAKVKAIVIYDSTRLNGIEVFYDLKGLYCGNQLSELDVSKNTALEMLICTASQLSKLDVSKNVALKTLHCDHNQLSKLDVSKNVALEDLDCSNNQLGELDVSKNAALEYLYCSNNRLSKLDVSKNAALKYLSCRNNQLSKLDVSKNAALEELDCSNNQLGELDVSKNVALKTLHCDHNQLSELDVSKNVALKYLDCDYNQLSELDVSKNAALKTLYCDSNRLSKLDVSKNAVLEYLNCSNNQLSELDVSKNAALEYLGCSNNQLSKLDVSKNTVLKTLYCDSNQLSKLDVSKNTVLEYLNCSNNQLSELDVSKNAALKYLYCDSNVKLTGWPRTTKSSNTANSDVITAESISDLTPEFPGQSGDISDSVKYDQDLEAELATEEETASASELLTSPVTYTDLLPNSIYNFYVLKDEEEAISSGNLLYIIQITSDENGQATIPFAYNETYEAPQAKLVGMEKLDIAGAEVTIENLYYTGEAQDAEPTVVYKGTALEPGKDYTITGDYQATEIGTYTIQIVGTGLYKGSLEKSYQILPITVAEIKLSQSTLSMKKGETAALTVTITPENATDKAVDWTSSDTKIAMVDSTGKVTAVSAGTASITCMAKDGSDKKATCEVTVTDPTPPKPSVVKVTKITLNKTTASVGKGKAMQLTATVTPTNATNKAVTWKSSNTKIATVSSTGKVTAKSAGTVTITCTAKDGSGKKATCKVTVTEPKPPVKPTVKVTKLTLNKKTATLSPKETLTLRATVTPTNATNKAVTWKSSNTKIATVSSTGKVTAKAAGTVTITCTAKDGSGKKATCRITVYNNTQAYVARIYTKALGRAAEPAGLNYWVGEINSKKRTPVQVAEEFFFAPEFTNKNLNNTEYVKVLYRTFMGREYDKGGLDYWVGRLNKGESRKSVLEAFAGCPEFQKIVKSFGL